MITIKVIKFGDGSYFNGVKGKMLRTTNNLLHAKDLTFEICDRDLKYLNEYGKNYSILTIELTHKIICEE